MPATTTTSTSTAPALSTEAIQDVRGQNRRRRRGLADGLRARHQHGQQERRQRLPRHGRLTYQPFAWNSDNTGGEGTPATRADQPGRLLVWRPHQAGPIWFFGASGGTEQQERHRPHAGTCRHPPGALPRRTVRGQRRSTASCRGSRSRRSSARITTCRASIKPTGCTADRRRRRRLTSRRSAVDRRRDVRRQVHVGVGQQRHDDLHRQLQQQGRQRPRQLRGPPDSRAAHRHTPELPTSQGRLDRDRSPCPRRATGRSAACDACFDLDTSSVTDAARRCDLVQARLAWVARVPDRLPGDAEQQLRSGTSTTRTTGSSRGTASGQSAQSRRAGRVPFHRQYVTSDLTLHTASGRDHDIGLYVQDTWKPSSRLTVTVGVRVDFVRRYDALRDHAAVEHRGRPARSASRTSSPRMPRTCCAAPTRGCTSSCWAAATASRRSAATTRPRSATPTMLNVDGVFETVFDHAGEDAAVSDQQFDPDVHQPNIDEYIARLPPAVPGTDEPGRRWHRSEHQRPVRAGRHQRVLPGGPFQPFGGFGAIDPNQGIVYRLTNNDWSTMDYQRPPDHGDEEPVARLPGDGGHPSPVAADERDVESDRSGAVHRARCVPERQDAVAHRRRSRSHSLATAAR